MFAAVGTSLELKFLTFEVVAGLKCDLIFNSIYFSRETALLVDPEQSSAAMKQWVALVVGTYILLFVFLTTARSKTPVSQLRQFF